MRRIIDNKKLLLTIISLLIVIIGGTYAWISSRLDATRMVLTLGSDDGITVTLNPYKLELTLAPVESYTNGKYIDVEANNQDDVEQAFYLYYEIKNISEALQSDDFQFKVMKSTDNGETWTEDTTGDFSSATTEEVLDIYEDTVPANTRYVYRVYLWIQEENEDQSGLQGTSFDGNLLARFDEQGSPDTLPLDSTMIPVKIANDGTVTAISKYDETWYDYDTKQWANAVITTSTNRATYQNIAEGNGVDTVIPSNEILAMYVWIPRFKYAFTNHNGSP